MARITKPLSDNEIKKSKPREKDYKLFDGGGLFLLVKTNGSKLWRIKYRFENKEKLASIGKYPHVTLARAREKLIEIKSKIANGINPMGKKAKVVEKKEITFKELSEKFLKFKQEELSYTYYNKQKRRLEVYVYDKIGDIEVNKISKGNILELLKNIPFVKTQSTKKTNKTETIRIVNSLLSQIFKFAIHNDYANNSVMQTIEIYSITPKKEIEHYKALTKLSEIKSLMNMMYSYVGDIATKNALLFLAYSALRSANVRNLKWDMIDFDERIILFPKEAMKMKQEFRLPIADTLFKILVDMKQFTSNSEYVFCSMLYKNKPLSENTLGYALKRMGVSEHTPHGFRSSFSTVCYEYQKEHGFISEVIEAQLAHAIGNSVKISYLRSDFLDDRLLLMEWYENKIMH